MAAAATAPSLGVDRVTLITLSKPGNEAGVAGITMRAGGGWIVVVAPAPLCGLGDGGVLRILPGGGSPMGRSILPPDSL